VQRLSAFLLKSPLIFFFPPFLFGLLLGGKWHGGFYLFLIVAAIFLVISYLIYNRYQLFLFSFGCFLFFCGSTLMASYFRLPNGITQYFDRKVVITGSILQMPRYYQRRISLILGKLNILIGQRYIPIRGKLLVDIYQRTPLNKGSYSIGQVLKVIGKLKKIKGFSNPGCFNYSLFWQSKGVWGRISTSRDRLFIMGYKDLSIWTRMLEGIRDRIRAFLSKNLSSQTRAVYAALLLGERGGLSKELKDDFSRCGVSHLLAISGLHLGMVMMLIYTAIWFLASRSEYLLLAFNLKKIIVILSLIPTFFYAALTHFSPATSRAFIMLILFWWILFSGRGRDRWLLLVTAAWLLLLLYPPLLYSPSFQFSFVALASIIYLTPRLPWAKNILCLSPKNWYQRAFKWSTLCTYFTVAAWLGTLPLLMHYFCHISTIGPLVNIFAIPAIALFILPLGLLSIFTLFIFPAISSALINLGGWGLSKLLTFIHFISNLPKAGLWVVSPNWLEVILLYSLILCLTNIKTNIFKYIFFATLITLLLEVIYFPIYHLFLPRLKVSILDVGRGQAIFIQFPHGKNMMIFGKVSSNFDIERRIIAPFLLRQKIVSLDYLLSISPKGSNGLSFLINHFRPKVFWSNKDLPFYKEINGVAIESYSPKLLKFRYKKFGLLLYYDALKAIVFIDSVNPKYVIFSGPIRKKAKHKYKVYSTNTHGMIKVITDGESLSVVPFLKVDKGGGLSY